MEADQLVAKAKVMVENWSFPVNFAVKDKVKQIARKIVKKSIIDSIC